MMAFDGEVLVSPRFKFGVEHRFGLLLTGHGRRPDDVGRVAGAVRMGDCIRLESVKLLSFLQDCQRLRAELEGLCGLWVGAFHRGFLEERGGHRPGGLQMPALGGTASDWDR